MYKTCKLEIDNGPKTQLMKQSQTNKRKDTVNPVISAFNV